MTEFTANRNARAEADAVLPDGLSARVLEPSSPAVIDGDFFADDPTEIGSDDPSQLVGPTTSFATTWDQLAADDASIAEFARKRWLGAWPGLGPVPANYVASREDYHRLAYTVVAIARYEANGKFGLRYTAGGFGTPFFASPDGADRQVRMVGNVLVDQVGDDVRTHQPGSLNDAAAFLGVEVSLVAAEGDSPAIDDQDRPLQLDTATGEFLGEWYGFATSVLEQLRSDGGADEAPGRLQLWPGHFDPAIEYGNQDAGMRGTFGASPGDDGSDEPYLYVGPWAGTTDDAYWNATSFPGALLPYAELLAADDPRARALEFYRTGISLLANR